MLKSEIKPRTEYAMREKRTPGTPFQRVRIIEYVRGNKWKAEGFGTHKKGNAMKYATHLSAQTTWIES